MAQYTGLSLGSALLIVLIFGTLQLLHIPAGHFVDWLVAIAVFEWLLLIVTVPWNIHFEAKAALADAETSIQQNIAVQPSQVQYVTLLARRSLWIAVGLHLVSAVMLYGLAALGIGTLGYLSAGSALLLTGLRPAFRAYEYIATQIRQMRQTFLYPREDIAEIRQRLSQLETTVLALEKSLDPSQPDSWAAQQAQQSEIYRTELTQLAAKLEDLRVHNQADHTRLSREAEQAVARISTDGQVLNHVRELVRFFKEA